MGIDLQAWVGRTETRTDEVRTAPAAALAATLDRQDPYPETGDPLPPLWHWILFLPLDRQSALGPEGHAKRGGFLPPVTLPRRMWAGGRLEFHDPLRIGDRVTRRSTIASVTERIGRTGPLAFVEVRHEISNDRGLALTEAQDIVYRESPKPGAPTPEPESAPEDAAWSRRIEPDDVFLFRYSALTFNAHRIHYDRPYATEVEGYPGLVVHGPLIATLLLDLVRRNIKTAEVSRFEFRAVSPLFDTGGFDVCGRPREDGPTLDLWAASTDGRLAMRAEAVLG